MMSEQPAGLEVVPVLSYPRQAEPGRTYLMTVDLRPSAATAWGAGPAEEVLFRCVLNAYPLFRCEAVGDPSLVCHRFGGTYGPARFLLTAADEEVEGTFRLTLANEWGVPVALYESDPIQVRRAVDAASEPSGLQVVRQQAPAPAGPPLSAARVPAPPFAVIGPPGQAAAATYLRKLFPGRPPSPVELHAAVHGLLSGVSAYLSPPVYYSENVGQWEGRTVGGLASDDPDARLPVPTHGVVEVRPFDEPLLGYARGSSAAGLWRQYGKVLLTNGWEFLLLGQDAEGRAAVMERFQLGEAPPKRRLPGGVARAARAAELAAFLARVMEPASLRRLRDHAIVIDARSTLNNRSRPKAAEDLRLFHEWLVDPLGGGLAPGNVTVVLGSPSSRLTAPRYDQLAEALNLTRRGERIYLYLRGGADGTSRPKSLYLSPSGQSGPFVTVARDELVRALQARNAFDEWVVLLHCELTQPKRAAPSLAPIRTNEPQVPHSTLFAAEWLDTSIGGGQATRDLVGALDSPRVSAGVLAKRLRSSPSLSTPGLGNLTIVQEGPPRAAMKLGGVGPTNRARVLVHGIATGHRLIVQSGDDVEVRTSANDFIYLPLAPGRYTLRRQAGRRQTPLEIRGPGVMEVELPSEPEPPEGSNYSFANEIRRVLAHAREESIRLQHDYVGTEHILLALLRSPESAGAVLLRRMGLDTDNIQALVEGAVRRGKATIALGELPYTSRAKKVLEFAMDERRLAGDETIYTDHVLLGLIREQKGIASEVLAVLEATLERALAEEVRGKDEIAAARAGEMREAPVRVRQEPPPPQPPTSREPLRAGLGRFARESRGPFGTSYNFTDRVRRALAMAREEAVRLQHDYVGTEHILLGLLREGAGVGVAILYTLDVDIDLLFTAVEDMLRRGKSLIALGELPYTARAKKVLEFAMSEARELKHTHIGTEHLLLGLIREEKGIAAEVLRLHDVTEQRARGEVVWLTRLESAAVPAEIQAYGPTFPIPGSNPPVRLTESEPLRFALRLAESAARVRETKVNPEHLLQGLLDSPGGIAPAVLHHLQVNGEQLREEAGAVRRARVRGMPGQPLAYSTAASAVLREMARIASAIGSGYVGTQHLLLALVRRGKPEAAGMLLHDHGASADAIVSMLRRLDIVLLAGEEADRVRPPAPPPGRGAIDPRGL
jgi:hypothetical protein